MNGFQNDDDFDQGAGETAISYTYDFLQAARSMIDHTFGDGFAAKNPGLVGACVQASAANLNAFMHAAANMPDRPSPEEMETMEMFLSRLGNVATSGPEKTPTKKTKKKTARKTRKA